MKTEQLLNYARDQWVAGDGRLAQLVSAIDGTLITSTGSGGLDFKAMLDHARQVGGPALRSLTVDGNARTDAADGDDASFSAGAVQASFGSVAVPATRVIEFKATVN